MTATTMKVCPRDGEPVIFTLEFRGAEYVCIECGWLGGVFSPSEVPADHGMALRHAELRERYEAERAERTGRPAPKPPPQDIDPPVCQGCGAVAEPPFDYGGKPTNWFSRKPIGGEWQYACSRACITEGLVSPF